MKKLPLGIQTFSEIIGGGYLYIDKTKQMASLTESGKYFFLSRPRRFGKSLLVSTLKEIFLGKRELFKGLYIYNKIDWQTHPVIHIDFSKITYDKSKEIFEERLSNYLDKIASDYTITLKMISLKEKFGELIEKLSTINKVVILIDEYDKPIIDFMTRPEKAKENRDLLSSFYSVLKGADQYLRFVFVTGVSKFSKVSIFSGLNNLLDITLDDRFSAMLGITKHELYSHFPEYIEALAKREGESTDTIKEQLKLWYNGYSWDGEKRVYNPTSILTLFIKNRFGNYWFATGTPTFLIDLIRKQNYEIAEIEQTLVGENIIDSYDFENIDVNSLLLQTGYLTVKEIEKIDNEYIYTLCSPNYEVKNSLLHYIMADYTGSPVSKIKPLHLQLKSALAEMDVSRFMPLLTSILAGIPYNLHIKEEKYYPGCLGEQQAMLATSHSLCYMILTLMGAKVDLEVLSDKGRVDAVLTLDKLIYVIEFKMGKSEDALAQIKERKYYEKFLGYGKKILLLGVGGFAGKELEYCLETVETHI